MSDLPVSPQSALLPFTPHNMESQALEALLLTPQHSVKQLCKRHLQHLGEPCFTLIVGGEGMGKSHLLAVLQRRFEQDKKVKKRVCLLPCPCVTSVVNNYLDLLMSLTFQLQKTAPSLLDFDLSIVDSLSNLEAQKVLEAALSKTLSDEPVWLLLDNIDRLLQSLSNPHQQQFLALLKRAAQVQVLATAKSVVAGHLFKVHQLPDASLLQTQELLQKLAQTTGHPLLAQHLSQPQAQVGIRTWQQLSQGQLRATLMLGKALLSQGREYTTEEGERTFDQVLDIASLLPAVLEQMDRHLLSQVQHLAPQQQKLLMLLSLAQGPLTVKALAAQARCTQQTASAQLKKLKDWGFLQSQSAAKLSYYEFVAPLMRLALQNRSSQPLRLQDYCSALQQWQHRQYASVESAITQCQMALSLRVTPTTAAASWDSKKQLLLHEQHLYQPLLTLIENHKWHKARELLLQLVAAPEVDALTLNHWLLERIYAQQGQIDGRKLKRRMQLLQDWKALTQGVLWSGALLPSVVFALGQFAALDSKTAGRLMASIESDIQGDEYVLLGALGLMLHVPADVVQALLKDKLPQSRMALLDLYCIGYRLISMPKVGADVPWLGDFSAFAQLLHPEYPEQDRAQAVPQTQGLTWSQAIVMELNAAPAASTCALLLWLIQHRDWQLLQQLISWGLDKRKNEAISFFIEVAKEFADTQNELVLLRLPKELRSAILST